MSAEDNHPAGLRRYVAVWRLPDAPTLTVGGFVSRMPIGVLPLATILTVYQSYGSYADAGIAVGLYSTAIAVASPFVGRLADRRKATWVVAAMAVLNVAMVAGLVAAIVVGAPLLAVWATAMSVGATHPPTSAVLRSAWNALTAGEHRSLRGTALSIDTISFESCFVFAPLIVGLFGLLGHPVLGIVFSALCTGGGAALACLAGATKRLTPLPRTGRSVLALPGIPALLCVTTGLGFAFGVADIAVPAFASDHVDARSADETAATLLALWGVGSILGGIWFGARHRIAPLPTQWTYALIAASCGLVALSLAPTVPAIALLLLVSGGTLAPTLIIENNLVAAVTPPAVLNEAYSWTGTITIASAGAGQVAAGFAVSHTGSPASVFLLAAAAPALAAAVAAWPNSALRRAEAAAQEAERETAPEPFSESPNDP